MALLRVNDEQGLHDALSQGILTEGHFLDVKRQVAAGAAVNRETARDLASFAIDGGDYVIGVDEATGRLYPVPLAGLPERIEQVCLSLVDPPLVLRSRVIPAAGQQGLGYVIVSVPPSPQAPHMVGHAYWARGDKTKYRLSDAEVLRLHERRRSWDRSAQERLNALVAADPLPQEQRRLAHLFLLAVPVPGRPGLVLDLLGADGWERRILELVHGAVSRSGVNADGPGGFGPHLGRATGVERRAAGWALTTAGFLPGRAVRSDAREEGLVELELREDGELRVFCGRASYLSERNAGVPLAFEALVVGICRQLLSIVGTVSISAAYMGSWQLGVAIQGLGGCVSAGLAQDFLSMTPVYDADGYREATRASFEEIDQRPGAVAERLLGRLTRALGSSGRQRLQSLFASVR